MQPCTRGLGPQPSNLERAVLRTPLARPQRQPLPSAGQPGPRLRTARPSASGSFSSSFSSADFDDYSFDDSFITPGGVVDYYSLLGVDDAAPASEVKAAYRALAKVCHPDFAGESGHNMCILLNEAYTVLMDPAQRSAYNAALDAALEDEVDGYTGKPLSRWMANTWAGKNTDAAESRAVFVDEVACIGCKQCVWVAPATFRIEPDHGRSRVWGQWLDTEDDMKAACDACPVSCIHWVDRADLPALEYVVQHRMGRTGVGLMMAGQGGSVDDVWVATANYMKERQRKEEERQRAARYSRAQDAARRKAAEELLNKQEGWFTGVAGRLGLTGAAAAAAAAMEDVVYGSSSGSEADDEYSAYRRVGRRRRGAARRPGYGSRGMEGGKVPADRALVPVGATRQVWERR